MLTLQEINDPLKKLFEKFLKFALLPKTFLIIQVKLNLCHILGKLVMIFWEQVKVILVNLTKVTLSN